jgi:hypothetical protein
LSETAHTEVAVIATDVAEHCDVFVAGVAEDADVGVFDDLDKELVYKILIIWIVLLYTQFTDTADLVSSGLG